MSHIHITRAHELGLAKARKLAFRWAETAEEKLEMECVYEEGTDTDTVVFKRSGVKGALTVTADSFVLDARLGLLLGVFRERIETEIVKNLDKLLAHEDPLATFDRELAKRSAAKTAAKKTTAKKKA